MNHFDCKNALPLIGAYTDGELSEAQAGPLRKHLMSCHTCRNSAQSNKVSRRWFQQPEDARGEDLVPAGFAARVAQLAFAGETGEHAPESLGHLELTPSSPTPVAAGPRSTASPSRSQLGFMIEMTGIAAAVLVALTVAFRMREMPSGEPLRAEEILSVEQIKDRLDDLNEAAEALSAPRAPAGESSIGSDRDQ